ncbi:AI-2E family transporter [Bacillus suaedae]|uniref:AI-2E family transporter n=1 Tax=Halalkalibacter suaedae TaxID=2822140 RepID=A0A940WS97_9BACI|nr:AI-2E family transporter [Bacillus suaedae]MBP3951376.1 AI-2E family transporter [Bacillus suaedae]
MDKDLQQKWISRLSIILLTLLILLVLIQLAPLFAPFVEIGKTLLLPVGIAFILAYLLHPLVEKMHDAGLSRTIAVFIIFLLILGLITYLFTTGIPTLIHQVQLFLETLPKQMKVLEQATYEIEQQVNDLPHPLRDQARDWSVQLGELGKHILQQIETIAMFLLTSMFSLLVIPFLVFYFLKDFDQIQRVTWYLTPKKWRSFLARYIKDVDHTIGSYIRGQLLVSLTVGLLSMIGLWILGVPYPILLGLFIAFMDLVPFFGPIIGAIPAVILAFLDSWQLGAMTATVLFVIQQIESNVLSPIIVGKSLHLHPALLILALIVGAEVGGFIGMLLAVPVLAITKVTLVHIRCFMMKD